MKDPGPVYAKEIFIVFQRFKFGWESYTSSDNSTTNLRPKVGEESGCVDIRQKSMIRRWNHMCEEHETREHLVYLWNSVYPCEQGRK